MLLSATPQQEPTCKTSEIKEVKEMKGFWMADAGACLLTSQRFKDQCEVNYFCKNNQSEPNPKKIKCVNGAWDPVVAPTCKNKSYQYIS